MIGGPGCFAFIAPKLRYALIDPETGNPMQTTNRIGQYRMVWKATDEEEVRGSIEEMQVFAKELEEAALNLSDFASAFFAATEEAQREAIMRQDSDEPDAVIEFLRQNRRGV